MLSQRDLDYSTVSDEELNMQRFCEDIVPDFTPLGGNRPDCAVTSGAAVSLSDSTFNNVTVGTAVEYPLPPDVFACAVGILCAPVIITGSVLSEAARQLCERRGPARTLSVRFRFESAEEMHRFRPDETETDSDEERDDEEEEEKEYMYNESWPWADKKNDFPAVCVHGMNDYRTVSVKMELPPEIVTLPEYIVYNAPMVKSIDLRSTCLTALGDRSTRLTVLSDFRMSAPQLSQVHLPSTVTSIGFGFLASTNIRSIDLRHLTGLTSLGDRFMHCCSSLTEVYLPPSVTRASDYFLNDCPSIVSIDLRPVTELTTLAWSFMDNCKSLTQVHLPPSVNHISWRFLRQCPCITSIDLRHLEELPSLGMWFMQGCDSLTEVHLPPSVSKIDESFLSRCPSITSIDLRHLTGLTSLGERFMLGCHSLTEVHLPDSITELPVEYRLDPKYHWVGSREQRNRL